MPALRLAPPPTLVVGVPELGVLAARLGDHPDDVAAQLEQPPVEGHERAQLRDRVAGVLLAARPPPGGRPRSARPRR